MTLASAQPTALTVALDRGLADSIPEVTYALRTLLRVAGFGAQFIWDDEHGVSDITYAERPRGRTSFHIPWARRDFRNAHVLDALSIRDAVGVPFLLFEGEPWRAVGPDAWPVDVVFATYWLLTGAREAAWPRHRWEDLGAFGFVLVRGGAMPDAPVSRWGRAIADRFGTLGLVPLKPAWAEGAAQAGFSFTHDVDYPQIIRWIEVIRVLGKRGVRGLRSAWGVANGTNHFWTFREWVDLEAKYGARPTFYFMARRGSLWQYARGLPDDFYDVRTPQFAALFAELRTVGCEIGLHASYLAYRSAESLRVEAERLAYASNGPVLGNRHHFWHLDPNDPNETLRRHELAGLGYDSSLGLEYFPGFRRGICHPFQPFHPGERREIATVQLPPAWMDDQFDGRRAQNGITDCEGVARSLLDTARATGGVAIVDYHSRGMNADFYPRYGPWLARLAEGEFDSRLSFHTAGELAESYRAHAAALARVSYESLERAHIAVVPPPQFSVARVTGDDVHEVAGLHDELFGDAEFNGHSVATLGAHFLERAFYGLNLENPDLHALVARVDGRVVGFSVYATNKDNVFRFMLKHRLAGLIAASVRTIVRRPKSLGAFWGNARYMRGEALPFLRGVPGWWVVAGVHPDARSPEFERRVGVRVAAALFDQMESHMREVRCPAWYGVVRPDNAAINAFLRRRGAREVGTAPAQGMTMRYYVKQLGTPPSEPNASFPRHAPIA